MKALQKAARLDLNKARYQYIYAVALGETNSQEAIKVLEASYQLHTADLNTIQALIYYYSELGEKSSVLSRYDKQTARSLLKNMR